MDEKAIAAFEKLIKGEEKVKLKAVSSSKIASIGKKLAAENKDMPDA